MKRGRILVVDDEAAVKDVLRDILESEGYEVVSVESATAALKEAEQRSFDLLLSDIRMPDIDGLELVRRFRALDPQIATVLITGYPSLETARTAIHQGAYDYILKPFNKDELCTAIAAALKKRQRVSGLEGMALEPGEPEKTRRQPVAVPAYEERAPAAPFRGARRSLAFRLGGALFLVGLLPLIVVGVTTVIESRGPKAVDQYFLLLSDYAALGVRQALEQGATSIATVAQDQVVREGNSVAVEDRLRYFNSLFSSFQDLALVDTRGQPLASSTYRYDGEWVDTGAFRQALFGNLAISAAHLSPGDEETTIVLAVPVRDPGERVTGVLVGELSADSITPLLARPHVSREGQAYIVDPAGQVIASGSAEQPVGVLALPSSKPSLSEPVFAIADEGGRDYVYAIAPVTAGGMLEEWKVVLRIPAAEAYAYLTREHRLIWIIIIGTFLAITIAAVAFTTAINRPIQRVIAAARKMASGDLSTRIEGLATGDMADLASSFNSMAQELETRVQDLEESLTRIIDAQEKVRREVAERLHGQVQTRLWVVWQKLGEGLGLVKTSPDEAIQMIDQARDDLDALREKELREIGRELHPSILGMGLPAALRSLRDRFEGVIQFDLEIAEDITQLEDPTHPRLPTALRLALYRVAQEATGNVIKHARATRLGVRLWREPRGDIAISIEDNGVGFILREVVPGLGMMTIRDYAAAYGGTYSIDTAPGKGTTLVVRIPFG